MNKIDFLLEKIKLTAIKQAKYNYVNGCDVLHEEPNDPEENDLDYIMENFKEDIENAYNINLSQKQGHYEKLCEMYKVYAEAFNKAINKLKGEINND